MMQTQRFQYSVNGGFNGDDGQLTLHVQGPGREGTMNGTLAAPGYLRGTYDPSMVSGPRGKSPLKRVS